MYQVICLDPHSDFGKIVYESEDYEQCKRFKEEYEKACRDEGTWMTITAIGKEKYSFYIQRVMRVEE